MGVRVLPPDSYEDLLRHRSFVDSSGEWTLTRMKETGEIRIFNPENADVNLKIVNVSVSDEPLLVVEAVIRHRDSYNLTALRYLDLEIQEATLAASRFVSKLGELRRSGK